MSLVGRGGNFAPIEIDSERDIALVGKFRCLLLDPIVQSPPFVNHDDRGEWAFALGSVENSLHGFVATLVRDGFAIGGEGGHGKRKCGDSDNKEFHGEPLPQMWRILLPKSAWTYKGSSMYSAPAMGFLQ